MTELFLCNGGVRLQVIDGGADAPGRVPLLIVPGLAESAADYAELIAVLSPRRCVAVTLRGRFPSDAPQSGYALADHVADIAAAAALIERDRLCLMAFSRGVAYGLGYALQQPSRIAGLILGDYPARHSALAPDFPDWFLTTAWRGRPASGRIAEQAVRAIQRQAREETFWDRLDGFDCPAAILHGDPDKGSQLSQAQIERYRTRLRRPTITGLPDSGHDLRSPDPAIFNAIVRRFLDALDAEADAATDQ